MSNFIKATNVFFADKNDCSEKRLFIAILSQAIHDAFSDHVPRLEKQAARNFLTNNNIDFKLICEFAGRNSDYVKEKITQRVLRDNGWKMDLKIRTRPPRNRKHKHLTGNTYYAAKREKDSRPNNAS